jgi:hypothetical protein
MSKHTPGSWTAIRDQDRDDGSEDTWYVLTDKEAAIAVGLYGPDARLIAAAPDLLAVCKRMIAASHEGEVALTKEQILEFVAIHEEIRAVIAKAEGVS